MNPLIQRVIREFFQRKPRSDSWWLHRSVNNEPEYLWQFAMAQDWYRITEIDAGVLNFKVECALYVSCGVQLVNVVKLCIICILKKNALIAFSITYK